MKVRVPASSANIGPGFDCFGIGWQLYNEIEFKISDTLVIEGCDMQYCNRDNLAYISFIKALQYRNIDVDTVYINFVENDVPVSRGLGSSACLIVAGVLGADYLYDLKLSDNEKLKICTMIEGHPDNVAPALFGGFGCSVMEDEEVFTIKMNINECWHFSAIIPDYKLSTSKARSVLPTNITMKDAVYNISHSCLLINALQTDDEKLLKAALNDKLHQPYRFSLIRNYDEIKQICDKLNVTGLCISGAGSTLLAIYKDRNLTSQLQKELEAINNAINIVELKVDNSGGQIIDY